MIKKVLREASKLHPSAVFGLGFLIILFTLYKGVGEVFLLYLLGFILLFFFLYLYSLHLYKKREVIVLKERKIELEEKKIEMETIEKRHFLNIFPFYLRRFLEIIDQHGLISTENIEKAIRSERCISLVLESGEGLCGKIKAIERSIFRDFIEKHKDELEKVLNVKIFYPTRFISGLTTFLLISENTLNVGEISRVISEEYKKFASKRLKEIITSEMFDGKKLSKNDVVMLKKFQRELNPPIKPIILVVVPYQSDLLYIAKHFFKKREDLEIFFNREVLPILRRKIPIGKIRIFYVFECVYGKESEIVKKLIKMENSLRERLKIKNFVELLMMENPFQELMEKIQRLDENLYLLIKKDKRTTELEKMINTLQKLLIT